MPDNTVGRKRIDDFALRDPQGTDAGGSPTCASCQAVVVVFLAADCPLAKLYAPRLVDMAAAYQGKGVAFAFAASNQHEDVRGLARYVRLHAIPFPVLRDAGNVIADRFAAESRSPRGVRARPRSRRICYRGSIDDQYGVGVQKPRATRCDLADALDAVLAGGCRQSVPVHRGRRALSDQVAGTHFRPSPQRWARGGRRQVSRSTWTWP